MIQRKTYRNELGSRALVTAENATQKAPETSRQGSQYAASDLIAEDIDTYLVRHQHKSLTRFITCGSVDDGKSTLIGRLLYDSKMIFEDQLAELEADSKSLNRIGQSIDFARLVDGLAAEREQGITIDVAYRFFASDRRKFIVADTPGHEQYTRNMVTAASTADLAVVLIDARKGVLRQTRRHSYLAHLLGIVHVVLAVNKMDLIDYDQEKYNAIVEDYRGAAKSIGITTFVDIPVSGLIGDNVTTRSKNMPWYQGPTLMEHLEKVELGDRGEQTRPFRMPVQWVNRPSSEFRGFSGMIVSGRVRQGDRVRVLPSDKETIISRINAPSGNIHEAVAGQSITLCLADEVDCSRGDVIVHADQSLESADQFESTIVWMVDEPMLPGRPYWIKLATQTATVQIQTPKYQIDVNTMAHIPAKTLGLNAIGVANVSTDRPLLFEPYAENRDLGGFIVIDKLTNATVAAGLLHFALRRSGNVRWQPLEVTRNVRASQKNQHPAVLWFTGLSGAGKSTIANLVEKRLVRMNRHTFLLDGDNVRHGLSKDLGFTDADRVENIRRTGEVAKLMTDAGLIVIAAFISPFRAERDMVRQLFADGEFYEIYIDAPLPTAEARDVKGLYSRARSGQLRNFTGIDSPYEPPFAPELHIDTTRITADEAADLIVRRLIP